MPPWIWRFFCDCQKVQDIKKRRTCIYPPTFRGPENAHYCQNEQFRPHADMI